MNISNQGNLFDARPDRPSIVEEFFIEGLYGYRNVGLTSSYAATILIARNGSGKTTLLACLDAALRCEFIRLRDIKFDRVSLRLRGVHELLVIHAEDIAALFEIGEDDEVYKTSVRYGIDTEDFLELVNTDLPESNKSLQRLAESDTFRKLASKVGYDSSAALKIVENVASTLMSRAPRLQTVREKIKSTLKGIEIVYLPTYRRIELPLAESEAIRGKGSVQARLGLSRRQLFSADIQFGLSDISARLRRINQQILIESGERYRAITANIINELVDGTYEREEHGAESLPDKDALIRFFSKIEQGKRFIGPRFRYERFDAVIPDVDKVYNSADRSRAVEKVLNYFLSKLSVVIDETKGLETQVQNFIDVCNGYLSGGARIMTMQIMAV